MSMIHKAITSGENFHSTISKDNSPLTYFLVNNKGLKLLSKTPIEILRIYTGEEKHVYLLDLIRVSVPKDCPIS